MMRWLFRSRFSMFDAFTITGGVYAFGTGTPWWITIIALLAASLASVIFERPYVR